MLVGKITATEIVIAPLKQIASFDVAMLIAVVTLEQNVIVTFAAVKMAAMMIARDSIGKLVVIKAAAMTHIVTFGFAKLAVANAVVANEIVVMAIAIVMLTVKGYQMKLIG